MSNRIVVFNKDPEAVLDYSIIWGPWLPDLDVITASVWILTGTLTEVDSSFTDTETTVWLSGGTVDDRNPVTNRITTADGRTEDYTFHVVIRQK
jgi:hypothetical protein